MPTPPTLISYTETASWQTAGSPSKATASVSWQTGDVIVVLAASEANDALGLPTATGLTFVSQKSNVVASTCGTQLAAAVAASTSSGVITVTNASTTNAWGFGVWVWRGSAGIGNSAEIHTAAASVTLTPTGADGGMVYGSFDFAAGVLRTIAPTPTNTRQRVVDAGHFTIYVADLADQVSGAGVLYGLTAAAGVTSTVVLEIKAASSLTAAQEIGIFDQQLSGQMIGQSWDR